ncbi:MAG TPA: PAS domain S-box protein [Noviherbaspirillum sp.]|nr:PAS domain S-box protein [Noviherbaspirillum sp.]
MPTDWSPPHPVPQAQYRQIIDSVRDFAIISMDPARRITTWSAGATAVLSWTEAEMLGRSADRIFTEEDCAAGVPAVEAQTALANGMASDERWHLRKDGERFWAVGELTPLHDENGGHAGFVKILQDRTGQKHAQARLKALNQELEALVAERTRERDRIWRNALDLMLVIDGEGVLRGVNPAWTRQLGYAAEDLVDQHFESFVHPADIGPTTEAIAHALNRPLVHFEVRIRSKAGEYHWFAWTAAPEEGLIYANGRDITMEKRQAEQLLMANEARLQLALEAGEMGAWEWDMQSDEILFLQGNTTLHGLPPTDEPVRRLEMQDYVGMVDPQDRPALAEILGRARAGERKLRTEYRIRRADGSLQWLEARGTVVADDDGRPLRMTGVSVNITGRKRTEQDLQFLARASAELSGLVDPQSSLDTLAFLSVPAFADWCAIDLLNEAGELERVSVAHVDPAKVKLARELHERTPPDREQRHGVWNVMKSGQPQLVRMVTDEVLDQTVRDERYRAALKELGLRSYIGVPLLAHGRTMGVLTFISAESGRIYDGHDLEIAADLARRAAVAVENALLYRALQRSDQGKDVFLATLAHELRNPLAAIANGLGILRLAPGDIRRVEHAGVIMERQVGQLRRLVDDLMDVSRIATGKIELRKEETDLVAVLANAIETTRPAIESAHHKLSIALPGGSTRLYADPVRLSQVFGNLLNNAAKYTDDNGEIEIGMDVTPEEFIVRVRDNGIGIEPDMQKSIFTIFRQGAHPVERTHGGLGIGLSLVDGLVRLHGGRVEVFSEGRGKGSEFSVHLPRVEAPAQAAPLEAARERANDVVRRVLVVDDNVDAANTITELLRLLGHEVDIEHDGLSAVDAALRGRPDVVLLDIGLPGIDGYEAARRIREAEGVHRIKLVALTGWGQEQDRDRAFRAGFDEHCVKPVGLDQLRIVLG